ncbi:hypothetical protein EV1_042626 [Malus domestica]
MMNPPYPAIVPKLADNTRMILNNGNEQHVSIAALQNLQHLSVVVNTQSQRSSRSSACRRQKVLAPPIASPCLSASKYFFLSSLPKFETIGHPFLLRSFRYILP